MLVVQEKNGPLRGLGCWKMPTGLVNRAEDICAGAVREVKEETGIDAEFLEILAIRQSHGMSFGVSDMFVWMDLTEFVEQSWFKERVWLQEINRLLLAHAQGHYSGFQRRAAVKLPLGATLYAGRTQG
eukprot:jgi/Mesen1/8499/ME000480S07864